MRFPRSAYLAPYLSQTGLTASWNGFLSEKVITSIPESLIFFIDCASRSSQSFRCSNWASFESFRIRSWSAFESASQLRRENTRISGMIRCSVSE
jgi:hypothetical protein